MKTTVPLPPISRLEEIFDLDYEKGLLIRKVKGKGRPVGTAGCFNDKYTRVTVDGRLYVAHRIIWALANKADPGDMEIDHVNQNKHDNRPCNLRLATRSQQMANTKKRKSSSSPYKGISKDKNKWAAHITINLQKIYLGVFDTAEEASHAYWQAARANFGEYACQGNLEKCANAAWEVQP